VNACARLRWGFGVSLTAVAVLPAVLFALVGDAYLHASVPALAVATAVQLAATALVVWGFDRPFVVSTVVGVVAAGFVVLGDAAPGVMYKVSNGTVPWIPIAAAIAASAMLPGRGRFAPALPVAAIVALRPWQGSWTAVLQGVALFAAPALVGLYFTARRQVVVQLRCQVEAGLRERHLLAEQARTDERARLAEEMHDVVTHRVSLMVLQAGALRVTAGDEGTRAAAEQLRVAGVQALDELRDLVGVLRAPSGGPLEASPAAPDLTDLVHRSSGAGLTIDFSRTGEDRSAPVVARTVYRIVQEALANVGKHAPAATATVTVAYGPGDVRVRVVSGTHVPADPELAATGSGQGLASLARRVDLMQGAFRAGPDGEGRFVVEACLPAFVPAGA
jgi:signal transduction histidine kinase